MNSNRGFDEVMIVNPSDPNGGGRFMRFHYAQPTEMGYYAQPQEMYGWGQPDMYGQYEPMGYYAEEPYLAEDPYGYYGETPEMYGYSEPDPYGQYEPMGYYAEEPYLAEDPYGEVDPYGNYAESPEMYGWGEPEMAGYTRDVPPAFNAGCPLPTNVSGFGETDPLAGYVQPGEVSPSCSGFTPQPGPTSSVPETFKPLW
jgi:hypothetical protein